MLSGDARQGHFIDNPAAEIPGAVPPGIVSAVRWHGGAVYAKTGSWLLSFNDMLGEELAKTTALAVAAKLGVRVDSVLSVGRGRYAEINTKDRVTEAAVDRVMRELPVLIGASPNRVYAPTAIPNDQYFDRQFWLQNTGQFGGLVGADIHAVAAWNTTTGSLANIVAVIDTGVQMDHPDLAGNIWHNPGEVPGNGLDDDNNGFVDDVNGWDFGELDNNPSDFQGHGTSCAGMIGAVGNNGIGVAGVNWAVSILPMKIANEFGGLEIAAIVSSHDYLTMMIGRSHNIVASNNSYGGYAPDFYVDTPTGFDPERDAIAAFIGTGATFVAAAGNGGNDGIGDDADLPTTNFPSSYNLPGIISVAATDNTDTITGFSNYGAQRVDIAAPGNGTLTASIGSNYSFFGGTSAASPVIAGTVALLKTFKPNASAVEIRQTLIDSADPLSSLQGKVVSGGRVNIERALRLIGLEGPVVRAVNPGPVTGQTDVNTGQVVRSASVTFNKAINSALLSTSHVTLIGDGNDNLFGTSDDRVITVSTVAAAPLDPKTVVVTLNLTNQSGQRLPLDRYRLTLAAAGFKDQDGNFLNGNSSAGTNEAYDFNVVSANAENEPNETLLTSTLVQFNASGQANFTGATVGNGLFATLDVDLYRVDLPRGGQLTAEIVAKRLTSGSTLDSVLRLFNALGQQIAVNDQFYGQDSFIDLFVTTGGTYYIGVSGFGNDRYNNTIAGSGAAQSRGAYTLKIGAVLVGDDRVEEVTDLPAPIRIPATGTQGSITSTLEIADSRQILDVNVTLDISHDFDGDLVVSLRSPAGTNVTLINRRGGAGKNFTETFMDDEAALAIAAGSAPFVGGFRPDSALSLFDGQSALGTWTLTVNDASALNSGQLNGWGLDVTLSNNIFGPYESNDTLVTAKVLSEIGAEAGGTARREAFIGDGGFGLLDRDAFKVSLSAGATLNALAVATTPAGALPGVLPALNTVLRIFDAAGEEVTNSAPAASKDSRIDGLVIRDGGVYYIVVTEGANTAYNPFIVTSGVAAVTTGTYTLSIVVSAGVSDRPLALDGNTLDVGFNPGGTFFSNAGVAPGTATGEVGLRWNGIEFLFDDQAAAATPKALFGGSVNGSNFVNQNTPASGVQLPLAVTDESDSFNRRVVGTGQFGNLRVQRTLSYGINDSFVAIDVFLTNLGASPLSQVSWMEAFNPEQGLNTPANTSNTALDIGIGSDATKPFVRGSVVTNANPQGLTIALAAPASDTRAHANIVSKFQNLRDSAQLLALTANDPNGAGSDDLMSLAYDLGTFDGAGGANASAHLRYFIFFGASPTAVTDLYATLNAGTGAGHLAADSATPVNEVLSNSQQAAQLPYRVYYPEGYANGDTFTFVPILNTSDQSNHVQVIARYETGERDQVIADLVIPAASRSGITITTPDLYAAGTLLVRKDTPYALEIRAQAPVAATFSHYDQFILAGGRAAIGEAFTTRVGTDWTFGQIKKDTAGGSTSDFLLFMNTTDQVIKIDSTFYPLAGSGLAPVTITQEVQPFRRSGLNLNNVPELAVGEYGVRVTADANIVACLSHYDRDNRAAAGFAGVPNAGSTGGTIPNGLLGIGSEQEILGVLNPNGSAATVQLSFLLSNGTTYRSVLTVNPHSHELLDVSTLPQFPIGQPYSVLYTSDVPVSVSEQSRSFGEGLGTTLSDRGFTLWGFGEGFRPPGDGSSVTETLQLFNPNSTDVLVEITIRFDNNLGQETFRQVVPARKSTVTNIHNFVTGSRVNVLAFYGLTVKAADPIVASMIHFDSFFPGAFTTLGTPLGISAPIV